ncbi:hypothetical protein SK128_003042 [Halocaridina rubra]|uniref:Phosphorylated adapter RNA export protein n=1 Tax=Halocaridina rubra TaxID=373956 RepID=A0AAN9A5B2_HALRR
MDEKEDGEVSEGAGDSFDVAYKPVVRPDASLYRCVPRPMPSSDEDYSSDSDADIIVKKRRPNVSKMDTAPSDSSQHKGWPPDSLDALKAFGKPKRRNNVWSTVMEEQVLSQEIGGFGLKRRLDQGDRSIESYDYTQARKVRELAEKSDDDNDSEEEEGEIQEDEDIKKKRLGRKRHAKDRLYVKKHEVSRPRELPDVEVTEEMTNEDVAKNIAFAMFEPNVDIIIRVVEVLGREKSLELFKETQELERNGGLLIMDGSRRRTSGGVFLQLLKKLPSVEKSDLNKIFVHENEWRKRKRAHRRRERHESKPQGEDGTEEGLHLGGLFSDDPGGAKCPGSTPVTSPQPSDNEDDLPASTINQLSPSPMPDQLPTPPPSVTDPRAYKPDVDGFNGEFSDPRAAKSQAYDDEFLLDTNPADEMDLF